MFTQENRVAEIAATRRDPETRRMVLEALENIGERKITFEGRRNGPSFLKIGGTHGNEILGILAVETLRRLFDSGEWHLSSGVVHLMLGNPRAIALNVRAVDGDINRMMTAEVIGGGDAYGRDGARVRTLANAIGEAEITDDGHSTNNPSVAFMCAQATAEHEAVYCRLPHEAVVHDPLRFVSRGGRSIDEYADDCGRIGICHEAGQAVDTSKLPEVIEGIRRILVDRGMMHGAVPPPASRARRFEVVEPVPYVEGRNFEFALNKARSFEPVRKGEAIGFWDGEPVLSPVDGVMLFPKKPEHQRDDGIVTHLAVPIRDRA